MFFEPFKLINKVPFIGSKRLILILCKSVIILTENIAEYSSETKENFPARLYVSLDVFKLAQLDKMYIKKIE